MSPSEHRSGVQETRLLWSCLHHCLWRPKTNPLSRPARALFHRSRCCTNQTRKHMLTHVFQYAGVAKSQSSSGYNDAHIRSGGRCLLLGSGPSTQPTKYNLFLAYPSMSFSTLLVDTCREWIWKRLLEPKIALVQDKCTSEVSAMFYCKSCCFQGQSLEGFRKHLSSRKHAVHEVINPTHPELDHLTRTWGKNYMAKPEYATAQIAVWWDMLDCPIPEGYDARQVRQSLEGAFKKLGYSGPVSITAYGDLKQTPDHILRGLSSTGVGLAQTIPEVQYKRMFSDLLAWQDHNPPPATIMFISDAVDVVFAGSLARRQQQTKYNLFLAYSYRPYKMSVLLTSAEWLWESLLAETRRHVLRKCSERGESTKMFYCKVCFCDCESLENFSKHLSSEEHAGNEGGIIAIRRWIIYNREQGQKADILEKFPKSKRLRKAYRTGFGHLHNHLRLSNR